MTRQRPLEAGAEANGWQAKSEGECTDAGVAICAVDEDDTPDWISDWLTPSQLGPRTGAAFRWRLLLNKVALKACEKIVGHVIESHCHNGDHSYQLGGASLSQETGQHRDTVRRGVQVLEDLGFLLVRRERREDLPNRHERNTYTLSWPYFEPTPDRCRLAHEASRPTRPVRVPDENDQGYPHRPPGVPAQTAHVPDENDQGYPHRPRESVLSSGPECSSSDLSVWSSGAFDDPLTSRALAIFHHGRKIAANEVRCAVARWRLTWNADDRVIDEALGSAEAHKAQLLTYVDQILENDKRVSRAS